MKRHLLCRSEPRVRMLRQDRSLDTQEEKDERQMREGGGVSMKEEEMQQPDLGLVG